MSRSFQGLALGCYFGLLILLVAWFTWLSPSLYYPVVMVLLVMVTPLLLPLRGLLHGRPRSYIWAGFLALYYFALGVAEVAAGEEPTLLAWLEVLLSLGLFGGAMAYIRLGGGRDAAADPLREGQQG